MGNNSSAADELTASKADASNFSPSTPVEGLSNARPRSNSKARRIVKAAKPSPSAASNDDNKEEAVDAAKRAEKEPGYYSSKKTHAVPKAIAESPSVARELEIELQEEQRKERLQSMADRQKAKREKLLQERRKGKKEVGDTNLQPNPFSRFLSVFSVEPAHPEHKRAYERASNDDDEMNEPDEKRLRPSEEAAFTNVLSSISDSSVWKNSKTAVAAAVAVAAVAIVVAFRFGRRA